MTDAPEPAPSTPLRPTFGIVVVALLRIAEAASIAAVAAGVRPAAMTWLPPALSDSRVILVVGLAWAGAALVGAVGLLLLRKWGWVLTMVMVGVGLAFSLIGWWEGEPDYVELLLLVLSAFYLNQRSARTLAERAGAPSVPGATT